MRCSVILVLKINYTKHIDRARKSVRYHAFRSREVPHDRKGVFSRDSDHADVATFLRSLDDPLTRERQTRNGTIRYAAMHRLMFSLSRREFEACGLTSWKPVIREAIGAFERFHGIRLEWVAAEHQSKEHPHVHVDIKSVYVDGQGVPQRLRITQELRQHLRWAVEGIMRRERERVRAEQTRERAFERGLERFTHSLVETLVRAAREDGHETYPVHPRRRKRPEADRTQDDKER